MRLSEFLYDVGRPIAYYPKLALFLKSVNATVFLCQLLFWEGKQDDEERWIYKKQREIEDETGLTRRELDTARRILREPRLLSDGRQVCILEECLRGVPPTQHYRINLDALDDLWDGWRKAPNQIGGKRQIKLAESATIISPKAPNQIGAFCQNFNNPENTAEITIEHTHTHPPLVEQPLPEQKSVSVSKEKSSIQSAGEPTVRELFEARACRQQKGSRFTLTEVRAWVAHKAAQPNSTIHDADTVALCRWRDGTADELIEEFLTRTPEQVAEEVRAPESKNLFYGEAAQLVVTMQNLGRDAASVIADMPLDDDVRQRLIEKFVTPEASTQ